MKANSIKINALLNGLKNLSSLLFPLITFPYVSRVLSVKGIGKYTFSNSIISYFLLIAGLGISTYAIREGAKYRDNKVRMSQFIDEIFTINVVSASIAYLLLFVCLYVFVRIHSYVICILIYSIQIAFSVIGVEWFFTIYEDFAYITARSIVFQIISLILLFIFVRKSNDYLNYATITVFATVGSNTLNFIKARKKFNIKIVFHFDWSKHLTPIFILFASNIASLIYINSDITILGLMRDNYIVGIYSISSRIYTIIKTVLSSMLLVTIPRLAMLYGKHKTNEYNNLLKNVTNFLTIIIIPAMVGLFLLSKQIVLIIAGKHFLRSVISLKILTFATIFAIFAWILSDCVLIPAKREKYILKSTVISAVINVIFNLIFVPSLAEIAAAISTVLSELSIFLVNYYYARDIVSNVFISKTLLINIASSLLGSVGIVTSCLIVNSFNHLLIVNVILSVSISVIVYTVILLLLRNYYAISILNSLKKHFFRFK